MHSVKVFSSYKESYRIKNVSFFPRILNLFLRQINKVKLFSAPAAMEHNDLFDPPKNLNGMKVLDRNAFKKTITISCLQVESSNLDTVLIFLKKYYLRIMALKPVLEVDESKRKILLNPILISSWNDFNENIKNELEKLKISQDCFSQMPVTLGYKNWSASVLLKAVLPKDEPPLTSYSIIGHIIHLNIKENLLDYKQVIAEILLDKVARAKTVVYKKNIIDNVYRTFEMEVLCGEPDFFASVKENGCSFEFDFSKVYWNPRLGSERARIVNLMKEKDVLFDVFAGVGPFSIPAAKKKVKTFANDLNPESFKWLNHNVKLNKKALENITTFNKDGGDFILTDVKLNLIKIWQDEYFNGEIYFVMNLPAIAPTFLKYFKGLITIDDLPNLNLAKVEKYLPTVHCHFFSKEQKCAKEQFEQSSGINLSNIKHSFFMVRKVSDSKVMYRATFQMQIDYLLAGYPNSELKNDEPLAKKVCT